MAPRLKRTKPNLRMLRLLVPVLVLAAIALGVRQFACAGDAQPTGSGTGTTATEPNGSDPGVAVDAGGEVTVAVGESFTVGGMTVVITSLVETGTPTGARYPIDDGPGHMAGTGESYYQAFARAENAGDPPARIDPLEFSFDAGDALLPPDPARTGPSARSLIRGASFDFIMTFLGPAGLEPRLVYRPAIGGTVIIEGVLRPDGLNGAAETASAPETRPAGAADPRST